MRYNHIGDTMQYKRKMGIDYGDKRIGVAFSDLLGMLASPYEVYQNNDQKSSLEHLIKLCKEKEVDEIIIGYPLNMQGEENERTKLTKEFGEKLKKLSGLPVYYQDERLSSFEAEELLKAKGMNWEKRKEVLDMFSAQIILQDYLNNK